MRELLRPLVEGLSFTHATLPDLCKTLGLEQPEEEGTKRERIGSAFDRMSDEKLQQVAINFLATQRYDAASRNDLQDILWADYQVSIPRRYRREIASALDQIELYQDSRWFDELLDELWVLDDDIWAVFAPSERSLRSQIERHIHRNPGDWTVVELFDKLGAFDSSDRRFALFLEGLVAAKVRPDEIAQRQFAETINEVLKKCHLELTEVDIDEGYPVFKLVIFGAGVAGRPKNLIFASPVKPDLRFRDAVNNDIEIVSNEEQVLVYDRSISGDGLLWTDLQLWWSETNQIDNLEKAKSTLYKRLRDSLPHNSPPQKNLFEGFYRGYGKAIPHLPALLPEVWLHWDPKTVRERGPQALERFRMDFLLLFPGGVRVVVEVDGKHHYADENGRAVPVKYASMVAADRALKLAGYEVYRFGASELTSSDSRTLAKQFFDHLFKRHGIVVST